MAIYLDANILHSWKTFAELERVALTIVSHQIQQRVLVPEVAAWEAEGHYRRSLERAATGLRKAQKAANEAFKESLVHGAPPLIDEKVEQWSELLQSAAGIIETHADDAVEGLRREALGIPPGRRVQDEKGRDVGGKGGRDAAIWLTAVRHHSNRSEEGHFISKNTSDFGATGALKSELARDLEGAREPLHYYAAIEDFLTLLGMATKDPPVSLDELQRRVPRTLAVVLPVTSHIPRAVFGVDFDWDAHHYVTELKEARAAKVLAARRYEKEGEAITVVNAEWELVVDCFRLPPNDEVGNAVGVRDGKLVGTIQLYLPDDDERLPQIISSRLAPGEILLMTSFLVG